MGDMNRSRLYNVIKTLLIFGTVLAALKMIFVDYNMDEEYQLVMSYRELSGDTLFGTMWEPHQTSAFLCTFFMWCYHGITGTYTGVLMFLRVVTTLIQAGISYLLYRTFSRFLTGESAALLGLIYFNIVPKLIPIPEFGSMQVWFGTLLALCMVTCETHPDRKGRSFYLILAGLCLSLDVLSYPSMLILYPFVIAYLLIRYGKQGIKSTALFTLTCGLTAILWFLWILRGVTLSEFLRNVPYIVSFDLTHDLGLSAGAKILVLAQGFAGELLLFAAAWLLALGVGHLSQRTGYGNGIPRLSLTILIACGFQIFYWVILKSGFEKPSVHLFTVLAVGIILLIRCRTVRMTYFFGIVSAFVSLLAVLYMSDLTFFYAIPHALTGVLFSLALLAEAMEQAPEAASKRLLRILLIGFAFTVIFGKGFTLRGGRGSDITSVRGIMKEGPAIGVLSDYMCTYIYNSNFEDYRENIAEGDNVLIVTNMVFSPGTTPYLFTGAKICHFSIVDPTSYDERLLTYWELYPEKKPNVIVVDCWYGELKEDPENWIMRYIENDFGYTSVSDGKYVRFYRKSSRRKFL